MKKIFTLLAILGFLGSAQAQVKEINPSIQWRFVRSQDLILSSGELYTFEFPAEDGFDYMFNVNHERDSMMVSIGVYDMQDRPVEVSKSRMTKISADMVFDVNTGATYKVVIGIVDPAGKKGDKVDLSLNLIRREKV